MTTDTGNDHRLGTAFIEAVCAEIEHSSAIHHPYLTAMREGDFPDVQIVYQDFAFQYGHYSARFTDYMTAVISQLSHDEHKNIFLSNLAEENGDAHDVELPPDVLSSITGQPHSALYRRFQSALGLSSEKQKATSACPGHLWSDEFLRLCQTSECIGVGAIGIGTELIVSRIYDQILDGLKTNSNLTAAERVFFDLHSVCDDEHAAQMIRVTQDLAVSEAACDEILFGVQSALRLRSKFWDTMLERARHLPESLPSAAESLSALGHQESL